MIFPLLNRPRIRSLAKRLPAARSAGKLLRLVSGSVMSYGAGYEAKFAKELLESVSRGDCVWDVGANVGYFTKQLADRVGESGCVLAFEPFQSTFERLLSETSQFPQVRCLQLALGADERVVFVNGIAESPSNNLIQECVTAGGEAIHVTTGSRIILDGQPCPAVIKIDVEGFEEDVLWGCRESLKDSSCHTVLIEVHYSLIEQRGFLRAPDRIVSILRDLGFRTCWLDPNHLKAARPRK